MKETERERESFFSNLFFVVSVCVCVTAPLFLVFLSPSLRLCVLFSRSRSPACFQKRNEETKYKRMKKKEVGKK